MTTHNNEHNKKVPQDEHFKCHPGPHPGLQNLLQDFCKVELTTFSIDLDHNRFIINNY